jgi:hypothetical protein
MVELSFVKRKFKKVISKDIITRCVFAMQISTALAAML